MLREHFVALSVSDIEDCPRFTGAVRSSELAHLKVSTVQSTEQRIVRSGSLARADRADYLQIGRIRRGRAVVTQDDRECVLTHGDFVLYDTTRPFDWQIDGHPDDGSWVLEVFTWPRASLSFTESEIHDLTAIAFDGRAGASGLLGRFLHDIVTSRIASDAGAGNAIVDEVGDLIGAVLRTVVRPLGAPRSSTYRTAVTMIDENLEDPSLSPSVIAAALGISTRQLHRVFAEQDTTVSRAIRMRRLEQCRREMSQSTTRDRSVGQISRRWGFADPSLFSRTFKNEYGMSPRQYRASAAQPLT
ncbi:MULTISPECIES: helix-turn-helix domain-containing protein [unclassified Rhodococcus (in: high G+C Gram-positive bacteria)]|uniref:helix-turn-helix domain-containing protein n=1 Tax=unclassified Rhodococcus (in: high G+C Gram-positive bacteria) TaxID=192944 RepID=UPI001BB308FD|nr:MULTISPECIES: helix-turn-helix domain-containing protein [unclassified Rhodococcus (in: high G+C Gram-positive bacteria)]